MEVFNLKTKKSCLICFLVLLFFSIRLGDSVSPASTTESTPNQQQIPGGVSQSEGNNDAPLLASPHNGTPVNNIPFAKPVANGNQGQQQEEAPNYPQQSINQPLSGFNQPYPTTLNQPYTGRNQPFPNINRPFGSTDQQGTVENAAFDNGVPKDKTCIQCVVLVSLITLMFPFV